MAFARKLFVYTFVVSLLITAALVRSAEMSAKEQEELDQFLLLAVTMDNTKKVVERLGLGANPDAQDKLERTALILAVTQSTPEVATALLDGGADPDALGLGGTTALHWALYEKKDDMVQLLLDRGATVDLFAAVALENEDRVKELLEDESAVNTQGPFAATPLFLAKTGAMATLLLEHGADPNVTAMLGKTPLHMAAEEDNQAVAEALVAAGADPLAKDAQGNTALDVAKKKASEDFVKLLQAHAKPTEEKK